MDLPRGRGECGRGACGRGRGERGRGGPDRSRGGRARGRPQPYHMSSPIQSPSGGDGDQEKMEVELYPSEMEVRQASMALGEFSDEAQAARFTQFLEKRDYLITKPKYLLDKKGSGGRVTNCVANFFPVQLKKIDEWNLHQYRVDFEPDQDSKKIRKALFRKLEIPNFKQYIYDGGHMLFSTTRLEINPTIQKAVWIEQDQDTKNEVSHTITIKYVKGLPWNDIGVLQFYNILVRKSLEAIDLELMGRHYYDHTLKSELRAFRIEVWPGYKTVMRPHEKAVLLNVEMVSKVIQTDSVLKTMSSIRANADPNRVREVLSQALCGRVVMTVFNRKTYSINGIDWNIRVTDTFETKKGPITFIDYYKNRYGCEIAQTGQPLLVSLPRRRDFHRGEASPILLVPELCVLTGLDEDMRSNFQLMKELKNKLIVDPAIRVSQLQSFMKRLVDCPKLKAELLEYGVRYPTDQMIDVAGRTLDGEKIVFGNNNEFMDQQNPADWTNAFRSKRLISAVPLQKWAIIVTQRDSANLDNLIRTMQRLATPLGYNISNPLKKIISGFQARQYIAAIDEIMGQSKGSCEMIFIILPNNQASLYGEVKRKCAVEYGIPSQCFLSKNAVKANMSVCTKVVVQMAAKQGGEPWSIVNPLSKGNVMVVGFDVYHGGLLNPNSSSVGAMVGSTNPSMTRYTSMVTMGQRNELSSNIGSNFIGLVENYAKINGHLPSRIMYYRDGVGEGQLSQVRDVELVSIESCLKTRYEAAGLDPPKLTFIVVSKRINARFVWKTQLQGRVNYQNPPPGTVVDDIVTLPERYDFFLVSQNARQGTISPTSYNVLKDHPSLTPKQLQMFTFKLCHLYFNWSGTVSVPAPCQYAHKLAYLTGMALNQPAHSNLANLLHFL